MPRRLVDEVAVVLLERPGGEDFLAVGQEEGVEFGAGGRLEGGDCWGGESQCGSFGKGLDCGEGCTFRALRR